MSRKVVRFKPIFIQKGRGPHLNDFVLTIDENGDVFYSNISVNNNGIIISNDNCLKKFSISVRWNVEGYGYLYLPADNEGELYEFPLNGEHVFNLNYELAKTRVYRNQKRFEKTKSMGFSPSNEILKLSEIANDFLQKARLFEHDDLKCAENSQKSLVYSLLVSELIEIEYANYLIEKNSVRKNFLFGCDTRAYFKMDESLFFERFTELFNLATITHYLKGDIVDFEPEEGKKQFKERDILLDKLLEKNITVVGRPLFWTHG
ncbi:MAG: hypothetical protein QXF76_04155, partial [Candidatus Anstonellales archaeon]